MLKHRIASSLLIVAVVAGLLWLDLTRGLPGDGGLWLLPALLFFAGGTAWDLATMLRGSGQRLHRRLSTFLGAAIAISVMVPAAWPIAARLTQRPIVYPVDCPVGRLGWIAIVSVLSIFVLLIREMKRYGAGPGGTIERLTMSSFVVLYSGLPLAMLAAIRGLELGGRASGLAALLAVIVVTKSADIGAYAAGKTLGRHKLIPRLSPGKTWEGLAGGVLTSTLVAVALFATPIESVDWPPIWSALLFGPMMATAGLIGDLSESLIKRDCGAKDSGHWLPGLGGVWDVTDSLIAAAVPGYLFFAVVG